jgi:hypothetical protein
MRKTFCELALLLALCFPLCSLNLIPVADIAGDNAVHRLTTNTTAQSCIVQVIVTGSGTVRVGDSTTSSTLGLPIAAGGAFMYPNPGQQLGCWRLAQIYLYVPSGATASVAYGG